MKNKKRFIFVIILLTIFTLYLYFSIRGSYLQILGIGEKYIEIFKTNLKNKAVVFILFFLIVFIATYITTIFIKKGLKSFFEEDKKQMPKLPNKSISLAFGLVSGMLFSKILTEKAVLAFKNTWFTKADPVFNLDIGYYIFQKPFIEALLLYCVGIVAILSLYVAVYYIIAFNKFFNEGISMETLKKSAFLKQLIIYACIIIVTISAYSIVKIQDTVFDKFLNISGKVSLVGAGLVDVTVKVWGYIIFAIFINVCLIISLIFLKKKKYKKLLITMSLIPGYLIVLFLVMICIDGVYVKTDELDKEKKYIGYNIEYTKSAYGIDTDETEIESSGTITTEDVNKNSDVIKNINILNKDVVLSNLEEYQTNLGFYTFKNTGVGLYNINEDNTLVYIAPREILSNESRTYNSKTYEYTHGFGIIGASASKTDETGHLNYLKNDFVETNANLFVREPRIYFGMQTNTSIVINQEDKVEYDYPLTSTTNSYNTYTGKAGLKLNFIDRLILGIKENNIKLAFSVDTTEKSSIITNRNVLKRAKSIMPFLLYDSNPYMIVTDEGELVWILDAYTISNQYPYAQKTFIEAENGKTKEINYIRNSVKVIINAYDGTMKFYITDRTDPIIMAYWNMDKLLFEDLDEQIPEKIANHIVYPKFLYDIQAKVLEMYHDVQPEVLYRTDDIWSIATENTNKLTSLSGTKIDSYYTMIKTIDSDKASLGLVVPYTIDGKQNITAYLVGTYDKEKQKQTLKIYKFKNDTAILGTIQLDSLIEQDETISNEIKALNVTGAKLSKNIIIVPVNNTLLYVEPIYQIMLNEQTLNQVPVLKKVVVASGNKVAIGDDLESAIKNLLSQEAVSIKVETNDFDTLINEIIKANKNLQESNTSNNWEMIGKDMATLQTLIGELEETYVTESEEIEKDANSIEELVNVIENN